MNNACQILCDFIDQGKKWGDLSVKDWIRLLGEDRFFVEKCDLVKGWELFTAHDWVQLLINHPGFADVCTSQGGWSKFSTGDWFALLKQQPIIANRHRSKIVAYDELWKLILFVVSTPRFCEKFEKGWDFLNGEEWIELFNADSLFAKKCSELNKWHCFSPEELVKIMEMSPMVKSELANNYQNCTWSVPEYSVQDLESFPQLVVICDAVGGWKDYGKLSCDWGDDERENCWAHILVIHPEWSDRCDKYHGWEDFAAKDWLFLLIRCPQFENRWINTNGWIKLKPHHWVQLLQKQPHLSKHNDKWMMFDGFDWVELLREQPVFSKECDEFYGWKKIYFCGRWAELLERQPQFANKCDEYNGWAMFDGFDWYRLLSGQPIFANKCNELNAWRKLLNYRPKEYRYSEEYYEDEFGVVPNDWSEYEHVALYGYPFEYETTFSREKCLAAYKCTEGLPVYSWLKIFYYEEYASELKKLEQEPQERTSLASNSACDSARYRNDQHILETNTDEDNPFDPQNDAETQGFDTRKSVRKFDIPKMLEYLLRTFEEDRAKKIDDLCAKIKDLTPYLKCDYESVLKDLSRDFWIFFLRQKPSWAVMCSKRYSVNNVWESFSFEDWKFSIQNKSDFLNLVKDSVFDKVFWDALIACWPDFLEDVHCIAWPYLISHEPQWSKYMKYHDWDCFESKDWERLFESERHYLEKTSLQPDNYFWRSCLSKAPQFANICESNNGWHKLGGNDWQIILSAQPQLATYCDTYCGWQKLDRIDWMRLVGNCPQFAEIHAKLTCNDTDIKKSISDFIKISKEFVVRERIAAEYDPQYDQDDCRDDGWTVFPDELGQRYPSEGY